MRVRLQELEAQLKIGSNGVRMIGIWGGGGSGKTTLASSLYMKISRHFQVHCIIDNIREKSNKDDGLETLQAKFLSRVSNKEIKVQSVEEGRRMIERKLKNTNVLVLLDDVSDSRQLEALAGAHNWFGSKSRIIITTRDENLLISHNVNQVCPVKLLSSEESMQLFNKKVYNGRYPLKDYETLSSSVVTYAAGLPLALKVLGSFLCGKDEKEWKSTLSRLKNTPKTKILDQLKISYDGLEVMDKELFLDIACFFRRESTNNVTNILEACGYHPDIGIKVLREKALITIVDGRFDMHDLVQEMGHYIVRGEHPDNPEKHSRVWKHEEINNMCFSGATKENDKIEAIQYFFPPCGGSSLFCEIVSNMTKLRWLSVILRVDDVDENTKGPSFLSNELRYVKWENYPRSPFPDSFQPMNLVIMKLSGSLQNELWKGYKHLPRLKALELHEMKNLRSTPDFSGLSCLQSLKLKSCLELVEIHTSLGEHTSLEQISVSNCPKLRTFPTLVHMRKLETLEIKSCHKSLEFPKMESNLVCLLKLSLNSMGIDALLSSIGQRCANLLSLDLVSCYLKHEVELDEFSDEFTLNGLRCLKKFILYDLRFSDHHHHGNSDLTSEFAPVRRWYVSPLSIWLRLVFKRLTHNIRKLDLGGCGLKDGEIPSDIGELFNLQELHLGRNDFTRLDFSLMKLDELILLNLNECNRLVKLPKLPLGVAILKADFCKSLRTVGYFYEKPKWLCQVSLMNGGVITDGNLLLESMLRGDATDYSMLLQLEGLEIAKEFTPPLLRGGRCRLKLPENWCNDFCGFLMCAAVTYEFDLSKSQYSISMASSDEDGVFWKESKNDKITLITYVSFASLRRTKWWNETYKEVYFSIDDLPWEAGANSGCSGFSVKLIPRKSGQAHPLSASVECLYSKYTPNIDILQNSPYDLKIWFNNRQDQFQLQLWCDRAW